MRPLGGAITHRDHPLSGMGRRPSGRGRGARLRDLPLGGRTLVQVERETIRQTLEQLAGNRAAAARSLGIAISTLYEKTKKYGL
ncbi:MAG: helix-turn-helix domain-containing protein [Polyangiaceae bacterium]